MNDYNCTCVPGFVGKNCSNSKPFKIKSLKVLTFWVKTEQWMVIVFPVTQRTTSLDSLGKVVLYNLQNNMKFCYLFWNLIGPSLYTQKGKSIHNYALAITYLGKRSFKRISLLECPCGIKQHALNEFDIWILYNYVFLVDMDILLPSILNMSFFLFRHWWLLSKPVSKQRNMCGRSEWVQLHLRAWLCRKELLK